MYYKPFVYSCWFEWLPAIICRKGKQRRKQKNTFIVFANKANKIIITNLIFIRIKTNFQISMWAILSVWICSVKKSQHFIWNKKIKTQNQKTIWEQKFLFVYLFTAKTPKIVETDVLEKKSKQTLMIRYFYFEVLRS